MKTAAWASMVGAAAFLLAAGCSTEPPITAALATTAGGQNTVAIRLASSTPTTAATTAATLAADMGPDSAEDGEMAHGHGPWWVGRIRPSEVDSLIVTVTKVEVHTMGVDSENAADSVADSTRADSMMNGHEDDNGDDWEESEAGWTSLNISGSGHLDLMHLPDSTSGGLMIATDSLPAGTYRHVRIFVTTPLIYFDTTIVTPAGDTLMAHTGYPVKIPSADSTGAVIKTDESFTVPAGGSASVSLYFDRDDTARHIILTGDGTIIVPPVMH